MKVYDFNILISQHKSLTKVIVNRPNGLLKYFQEYTLSDVVYFMQYYLKENYPYQLNATASANKIRYKIIEDYEKKIISSLELKHNK